VKLKNILKNFSLIIIHFQFSTALLNLLDYNTNFDFFHIIMS